MRCEQGHELVFDEGSRLFLHPKGHCVPDPATQNGCTSCEDLRHGLAVGDRVVVIAPNTLRMHASVIGLAIDTADLMVDGRGYPLGHVHCKWLSREDTK